MYNWLTSPGTLRSHLKPPEMIIAWGLKIRSGSEVEVSYTKVGREMLPSNLWRRFSGMVKSEPLVKNEYRGEPRASTPLQDIVRVRTYGGEMVALAPRTGLFPWYISGQFLRAGSRSRSSLQPRWDPRDPWLATRQNCWTMGSGTCHTLREFIT